MLKSPGTGPRALRALINHEPIVRCLGAHDVLSAKLIEQAGLECIFIGGYGCSASMLGVPDINLISLSNMCDIARRIRHSVKIPMIIDGETGHGDLHNVHRTVQLFEDIGVAGITFEDQVMPKRCGHFSGKKVIPTEEMVLKIHAALDARKDPDLVIIARTDARAVTGLEDAIDRACAYGEAGADICYIESPVSEEELELLPKKVPYPLLINMLPGGQTPIKSVDELRDLGYKIVMWPIDSVLATATIVRKLAQTLITKGRIDTAEEGAVTFEEMQSLLGLPEILSLRERIESRARQQRRKD